MSSINIIIHADAKYFKKDIVGERADSHRLAELVYAS